MHKYGQLRWTRAILIMVKHPQCSMNPCCNSHLYPLQNICEIGKSIRQDSHSSTSGSEFWPPALLLNTLRHAPRMIQTVPTLLTFRPSSLSSPQSMAEPVEQCSPNLSPPNVMLVDGRQQVWWQARHAVSHGIINLANFTTEFQVLHLYWKWKHQNTQVNLVSVCQCDLYALELVSCLGVRMWGQVLGRKDQVQGSGRKSIVLNFEKLQNEKSKIEKVSFWISKSRKVRKSKSKKGYILISKSRKVYFLTFHFLIFNLNCWKSRGKKKSRKVEKFSFFHFSLFEF